MRINTAMLLAFFAFSSCGFDRNVNTTQLGLIHDYSHTKIISTDSIYLDREINSDTVSYTYRISTDTLSISFSMSIANDSSITLYGKRCPQIASKAFKIRGIDFEILKFYYDEEDWTDEESSYFFSRDYGILVVYNNGWLSLINSLEFDDISRILVDSILSDRTGFYEIYMPPPPPRDSLSIFLQEI